MYFFSPKHDLNCELAFTASFFSRLATSEDSSVCNWVLFCGTSGWEGVEPAGREDEPPEDPNAQLGNHSLPAFPEGPDARKDCTDRRCERRDCPQGRRRVGKTTIRRARAVCSTAERGGHTHAALRGESAWTVLRGRVELSDVRLSES